MKVVYKVREDGTFDFSDSIETDTIIEGYGEPDPDKHYKDDGSEMTEADIEAIRNAPQPPTDLDILGQQIVDKDLQILDLQIQNSMLGSTLVSMELRLLALEGGEGA